MLLLDPLLLDELFELVFWNATRVLAPWQDLSTACKDAQIVRIRKLGSSLSDGVFHCYDTVKRLHLVELVDQKDLSPIHDHAVASKERDYQNRLKRIRLEHLVKSCVLIVELPVCWLKVLYDLFVFKAEARHELSERFAIF